MNIYIVIKARVAEVLADRGRKPLLVCGNADNRIVFTFDDEWSKKEEKVARFVYRECNGHGKMVYCDVPIVGNGVTVPFFQNVSEFWVGVIAEDGMTTSVARIDCISSISGLSTDACEETDSVTVTDLNFENGDHIITSKFGKPIHSLTIQKPSMLVPENIREGITIAGIVGSYSGIDKILPAPVITLDGDILNIKYDGEATSFIMPVFNGVGQGTIDAESEGETQINVKRWLSGNEAGTYTIVVEAYGDRAVKSSSNEVSYTFDGTVDDADKTYIVVLGGTNITVSYKIGSEDLSEYVESWDEIEPDGTVTTPNTFTGLTEKDYVLLYLPEGVSVSEYSKCAIKVFDDPRFIQLYNFSEAFAIVNFVSENEEGGGEEEPEPSEKISFAINGAMYSAPAGYTWEDWINSGEAPADLSIEGSDVLYGGLWMRDEPSANKVLASSSIFDGTLYYVEGLDDFWCSRCGSKVGLDNHYESMENYLCLCGPCLEYLEDPENNDDPLDEAAEEEEDQYIIGFSADKGIEIEYKVGTSDLSEYVESWDDIEPDGRVVTMGGIAFAASNDYLLLRLPAGVGVKRHDDCSMKTYEDSRFVQLYGFTGEEASVIFLECVSAPTISLDGDVLNIEYDGEDTSFFYIVANGISLGAREADSTGTDTWNLKNALSGLDAGTYTIAVKAYGSGFNSVISNEVSYTFDGTVSDEDKTYVVALGGQEFKISYKIGSGDLSEYVENWDEIEPDGTLYTPNTFTGLTEEDSALLYLPEGVSVSGYMNTEIKTFDDPRFIQIYNFQSGFAVVNFKA